MGYERKSIQILGGGFNLLPPADKTPITDYLLAQNWRVDREGKLLSRWGYPRKFAITGKAYAHSGANTGGPESDYYIGANAPSGSNPGSIYYDPDHISTPIVTGLSGGRLGMVPMNGWMWFMDPQASGRHNVATGVRAWGVTPPASAPTVAAGTADPTGPDGTYTIYYTWQTSDLTYETNPSPGATITVTNADINVSGLTSSSDPLMTGGWINVYASGGTLGGAYLLGQVVMGGTTFVWDSTEAYVVGLGILMPTDHDPPPTGASGVVGPYFSRLFAWKGNRLFYTNPGQPQYWPGAADQVTGNWVDVGMDGENIMWCTMHPIVLVIYKERSIWYLAGDPETGTLQLLEDGVGLCNAWAVAQAGAYDYFVAPGSLRRCNPNLGRTEDVSGELRPMFTSRLTNTGHLSPPGAILPGPTVATSSLDCYAIALGYAMGKLYVSYGEYVNSGVSSVLMVYDEGHKRWMYHRNNLGTDRFYGFLFDGFMMQGLTGSLTPSTALGYNLDDFRVWYTLDEDTAGKTIECIYQSHFDDVGLPDNQKNWLEVVVDYVINSADTGTVYVNYDNFFPSTPSAWAATAVGTLPTSSGARKQVSFALGTDGVLAKNISVTIRCDSTDQVEIHNVYLYYYVEARLALAASTIPIDLGSPQVKQCKELMLDVDASGGSVGVNIYSDLPGNALAVRQTPTVTTGGRAIRKFPFSVTEGFLWRVALKASSGAFRLYSARLLMRPIGTYIEAYEAAAGFVWDSQEMSFESGLTHIQRTALIALAMTPIKRFREIRLEIDTFNANVTVTFLTDLPGNAQASRATFTVNTGSAGRRYVSLQLPAGTAAPVEGRMCRIQISGSAKFVLYDASVEVLAVGVYVEAYEAAAGAVYDSREVDFGSTKVKEARELELDIETTGGAITATLYSDIPSPYQMAQVFQSTTVSTTGRQKIKIPMTHGSAPYDYPLGRLFQLILTGTHAYRLYSAKIKMRELGTYLTGDEAGATPAGVWDSTPLDLETERYKDFKKLEFEVQTDAAVTLNLYTDQAGAIALEFTTSIDTSGNRETVKIPLPPGLRGRLLQAEILGAGVRLFSGRVWWRPVNEPKAQWEWSALPIEPTPPTWSWAPFPVAPTEAQWFWARVASVEPTPDKWEWVNVDVQVSE